jgi:hypothetical protein
MMMELLRLEHLLDLVIFWSESYFEQYSEQLPESKLLRAIFGAKAKELRIILIECPMVNMVELLKQ